MQPCNLNDGTNKYTCFYSTDAYVRQKVTTSQGEVPMNLEMDHFYVFHHYINGVLKYTYNGFYYENNYYGDYSVDTTVEKAGTKD